MTKKDLLKRLILPFAGKSILQPIYETMYYVSLVGMNYGLGVDDIKISGEKNALKYVKKKLAKLSSKLIFFDVGANKGDYSNLIIKTFKDRNYSLYAFEPSDFTYKKLYTNVRVNENVSLINLGMSDQKQSLILYKDKDGSGEASVYKRNLEFVNRKFEQKETIQLTTIDDFCIENKLDYLDFLKIDVEGHELNVFNGASRLLEEGKIKFIQFEFGGTNIDSNTNFKNFYTLLRPKYKIFRILNNGLREIKQYNETHEIYLGINFLAELI